MVAVSLMPPVDQCASCEGRKAALKARDIATDRESAAFETARQGLNAEPSPGALPPIAEDMQAATRVNPATRPLLAPDLALQASEVQTSIVQTTSDPAAPGDNPALRLQAFQAYGATSGARSGS
jgi:hypothetical protein